MTNEEKARDIALCGKPYFSNDYEHGMFDGAEEMAEWKDEQFDSMIIHFFHLIQDGIPFGRAYKQVTGRDWQNN